MSSIHNRLGLRVVVLTVEDVELGVGKQSCTT